jgi:hypothetical protein
MKVFKAASIVLGVVLLALAALVAFMRMQGGHLDKSSKAYVDTVVPKIVSNWSSDDLLREGSRSLKETVSRNELVAMFGQLSTLGPLIKYEGSEGKARILINPLQGRQVSAKYVAEAKMARGHVTVDITLVAEEGAWQVNGFYVHPRASSEWSSVEDRPRRK